MVRIVGAAAAHFAAACGDASGTSVCSETVKSSAEIPVGGADHSAERSRIPANAVLKRAASGARGERLAGEEHGGVTDARSLTGRFRKTEFHPRIARL